MGILRIGRHAERVAVVVKVGKSFQKKVMECLKSERTYQRNWAHSGGSLTPLLTGEHKPMMQAFSKIIVEEKEGHWTAWFDDLPQIATGGEYPCDAIKRLLQRLGEENFDAEGIIAVSDGTREGHLEFLLPLLGLRRIPAPSMN
jgi:hypothetical protein